MSHEIETRFVHGEQIWAGIGANVAEAQNRDDAQRLAGLTWGVEQRPLHLLKADGTPQEVPGYVANVRDSDESVLGVTTPDYTIVTPGEVFDFAEALASASNEVEEGACSGAWYESAGSLREGRRIWVLLATRLIKLLGDPTRSYLCIANSYDGSTALRAFRTHVRVECNNTLTAALNGAERGFTFRHVGRVQDRLMEAKAALSDFAQYDEALAEWAEQLHDRQFTLDDMAALKEDLFGPWDALPEETPRELHFRRDLLLEFDREVAAPDLKPHFKTAWWPYQAVAGFASHHVPARKTYGWAARRFERTMIEGDGLLEKAQHRIEALVGLEAQA